MKWQHYTYKLKIIASAAVKKVTLTHEGDSRTKAYNYTIRFLKIHISREKHAKLFC